MNEGTGEEEKEKKSKCWKFGRLYISFVSHEERKKKAIIIDLPYSLFFKSRYRYV